MTVTNHMQTVTVKLYRCNRSLPILFTEILFRLGTLKVKRKSLFHVLIVLAILETAESAKLSFYTLPK